MSVECQQMGVCAAREAALKSLPNPLENRIKPSESSCEAQIHRAESEVTGFRGRLKVHKDWREADANSASECSPSLVLQADHLRIHLTGKVCCTSLVVGPQAEIFKNFDSLSVF